MHSDLQLIIIRGTPGAGKSSLGRRLKKIFTAGALIEADNVRGMLNNVNWEDEKEHLIALEAVSANTLSFLTYGVKPVIVVDMFMPDKLERFLQKFQGINYTVISLLVDEPKLRERLETRKEGFKNVESAIAMNQTIRETPSANEMRIDTEDLTKNEIADRVAASLAP